MLRCGIVEWRHCTEVLSRDSTGSVQRCWIVECRRPENGHHFPQNVLDLYLSARPQKIMPVLSSSSMLLSIHRDCKTLVTGSPACTQLPELLIGSQETGLDYFCYCLFIGLRYLLIVAVLVCTVGLFLEVLWDRLGIIKGSLRGDNYG